MRPIKTSSRDALLSLTHRARVKGYYARQHLPVVGQFKTAQYLFGRNVGRPIETRWNGSPYSIWVRLGTTDVSVFHEVLVGSAYDFPLNQPAVIIDGGANIGLTSIWFASKFPDARIIAVEPERSNYELLVRNVEPFPNVTTIHAALWCHSGTLVVEDPNDKGAQAFQTRETADSSESVERVRCLTVTELMSEHDLERVDLLKVDIEGAEKEVFGSADAWIGSVGAIAVELHDRFKVGCSRSFYEAVTAFPLEENRGEIVFVAR